MKRLQPHLTAIAKCVLLGMALLGGSAGHSHAQSCSFSIPTINFGNVDLTTGATFDTTVNLTITCTGQAFRLVRICPNILGGSGGHSSGDPRFMVNGSAQLGYNIFADAGFSNVWGSAFWSFSDPPFAFTFLGGSGTGSNTYPVRVRIYGGQTTLPSGVYTSSFAGPQTLFAYEYLTFQSCQQIGNPNATQVPFIVQANNIGGCSVAANDLNFGTVSSLATTVSGSTSLAVRCSSGTNYQVSLNGGLTGATNPTQRKMASGPNQLTYGLYRNAAGTAPWGATTGTNTQAGVGTGNVQNFTVHGRIPPQVLPPPGTYSDTIVVTVTY